MAYSVQKSRLAKVAGVSLVLLLAACSSDSRYKRQVSGDAVSYTHLDVYKRQVWTTQSARISSSVIPKQCNTVTVRVAECPRFRQAKQSSEKSSGVSRSKANITE